MSKQILVTGGAGFIGSHLVDALLRAGHQVRVFDNLEPQVHGDLAAAGCWPAYCHPEAEYILGDVRDLQALAQALQDVQVIYHFAALTGVGQSMYEPARYTSVNIQGTANLLDLLVRERGQVEKLIVSSSRAVYGEGLYHCQQHGTVTPPVRPAAALENHQWELFCPFCQQTLEPRLTPENSPLAPGSIYAISKQVQEQLLATFSMAYDLPVIALRFFNVYGPRQSLSNPYTGILSTFITRLFNQQPPQVYEDGAMTRDFVHVADVVQACVLALELESSQVLNVGSGRFTTILEIASLLSEMLAPQQQPEIVGLARVGDIRHCSADLSQAQELLGYQPRTSLRDGLAQVVAEARLLAQLGGLEDRSAVARDQLRQAGLLKS